MLDARANRIEAGDLIAYPGRSRSSVWLSLARVNEVLEEPGTRPALLVTSIYGTRQVKLTRVDNVIVVEKGDGLSQADQITALETEATIYKAQRDSAREDAARWHSQFLQAFRRKCELTNERRQLLEDVQGLAGFYLAFTDAQIMPAPPRRRGFLEWLLGPVFSS